MASRFLPGSHLCNFSACRGRIVGNLVAGPDASYGYQAAYWWSTLLVTIAAAVLYFGFRPTEPVHAAA